MKKERQVIYFCRRSDVVPPFICRSLLAQSSQVNSDILKLLQRWTQHGKMPQRLQELGSSSPSQHWFW